MQNTIIHIPGKGVPQVLLFLKDHLDDENYLELVKFQDECAKHKKSGQGLQGLEKYFNKNAFLESPRKSNLP